MTQKNKLQIRNKTNEFLFKNLIKKNKFLIISYKNDTLDATSKTITKNQICNSLSNIINKKTEKFPLKLNTFNNAETMNKYINSTKKLIISVIKSKNIFIKNSIQFKKISFSTSNLILKKLLLIKKLQSLKVVHNYLTN